MTGVNNSFVHRLKQLSDCLKKDNRGWVKGRNLRTDKVGYFPMNYVEITSKTALVSVGPATNEEDLPFN